MGRPQAQYRVVTQDAAGGGTGGGQEGGKRRRRRRKMPPPPVTLQPGLGRHPQPSAVPGASGSGLELRVLCSARASRPGPWLLGPGSGPAPRPCRTRLLSFAWQPAGEDGEARAGDTPAAGGEVASEEQPLQNGLHAEGQGGEGVVAPPRKELPPGRATPSKAPSPAPCPAAAAPKPVETPGPEAPKAAKLSCLEKSPRDPGLGGSPTAPAPAPSKGPQRCSKVPAKEGNAPKGTGPESTKKEKGAPLSHEQHPAKASGKGPAGKEPEKMKKDVGGGKKELREIKKPGKTTDKSEGPKGEPGGTQEKSEDVAKEVGKVKEEPGEGKEAPGESKEETGEDTDKDQVTCPQTCRVVTPSRGALMPFSGFTQLFPFSWAWLGAGGRCPRGRPGGQRRGRGSGWKRCCPWGECSLPSSVFHWFLHCRPLSSPQAPRDVWYEAEKVWLVQQDGFTLGNLPSSALAFQSRS